MPPRLNVTILLCLAFVFSHEASSKEKPAAKQPYNLKQPRKKVLKKSMDEISGIVYEDKTGAIVAINDEKGKIYSIDSKNQADNYSFRFASDGDFEDIVKAGEKYFVLRSDGTLFESAKISAMDLPAKKYNFPLKKNEFEGLYFDEPSNQLRLLCKSCEDDKSSKEISVYGFDLKNQRFLPAPVMLIDVKSISAKSGGEKIHFKPSAIAIHPLEKKLYILSSVNKMLVITNLLGKAEYVWLLDPVLFKQPEGIAFGRNGDMYISNEASGGAAEILFFRYQPE